MVAFCGKIFFLGGGFVNVVMQMPRVSSGSTLLGWPLISALE